MLYVKFSIALNYYSANKNSLCQIPGSVSHGNQLTRIKLTVTDQTNITNAYVSGLKEDLNLNGNQLNYFNVCYYTAYVVFQVPGLLLMSRPKL